MNMFEQRLTEEEDNPLVCLWMSFADGDKPKGQQFLGVIVMREKGLASAMQRAWQLGINPGGEIQCTEIPEDLVKPKHFDRLLSKEQLEEYGYI